MSYAAMFGCHWTPTNYHYRKLDQQIVLVFFPSKNILYCSLFKVCAQQIVITNMYMFSDKQELIDDDEGNGRLHSPGYKWRLVISYDGTRYSGSFDSCFFSYH